MGFADEMKKEAAFTRTENGAVALNTTGDACLDLFSTIGALRKADDVRVQSLFAEAYKENPLFANFLGRTWEGADSESLAEEMLSVLNI